MLRTFIFDTLKADATLAALGFTEELYPSPPDSPIGNRFMVLRWGIAGPRAGQNTTVRAQELIVWVYDREPDYGAISDALKTVYGLLIPMAGVDHGSGWILEVSDNGSSEDLFDPTYEAVMRNWTFTITASES